MDFGFLGKLISITFLIAVLQACAAGGSPPAAGNPPAQAAPATGVAAVLADPAVRAAVNAAPQARVVSRDDSGKGRVLVYEKAAT